MRRTIQVTLMSLLFAAVFPCLAAGAPSEDLAFNSAGDEAYSFDTGTLKGMLRSGGKSKGLSSLIHVPSGIRLDGGGAGIFSHYRVFTANQRYGNAAWARPSRATQLADGAVQILWPAGDNYPFDMTAMYRWRTPDTLDVETSVKAHQILPKFESFLASYFAKDFPASSVYAKTDAAPGFVTTEQTFGTWQMFPRDPKAIRLIQDGRWEKDPNPVAWAIRPDMALPIGVRRHTKSGLTAIVMAPPRDCFAVSTPYVGEGHFSLYLSLFGRSVAAEDTATVHSRLVIAESPTDAQILALYETYMKDLRADQARAATTARSNWPFFALCMDTHDARKRTLAEQATLLKELGYAGCAHLWLDQLETRVKTLTQAGLRLFQVYVRVDLSKTEPFDAKRMAQILPVLKPHQTQLALLITGGKPSDTALDDQAVRTIKRLADMTRPHGVTTVLYPHTNDWLETCADAVRIAEKINRPGDVGVMFNLCHWMKADPNRNLRAVLQEARPWLMAVSLSGSDTPDQVRAGPGQWIQPLDQGSYDIKECLRILEDTGYASPVGLQCYGIGGDAKKHLARSVSTWGHLCDSVSNAPLNPKP
ncbi:MAG: TIM barrel protein [Planctomycetes bacterium]|nr:TIM barrel protein [Planctomycetota bacterium]